MSTSTTDFFQRQDDARRNTGRLIILFALAVLGLSGGTYIALALLMGTPQAGSLFDPFLAVVALVCTGAFIFMGSAYKVTALSKGGSSVAESLGGREVDASSSDPLERRLVNVVEEMSLASGVPVPRIYILDNEPGINAFAAGYTMNDAAVAVTRGGLEQLTRDELQGVMAHEFSHILNGDMRLNIRLIGVIHGILLMFLAGRILMRAMFYGGRGRSSSRNGGGGLVAIAGAGLVLMVFGYAGVLCGRLIKSAVSRQREYLADSAAVQFTRNPEGLAGALKKIGGFTHGSAIQAANAEEVSHMCFGYVKGTGIKSLSSSLMSTHPPLTERIRRIDPSFQGDYSVIESSTRSAGQIGVSAMVEGAMDRAGTRPSQQPKSNGGGGASMAQGAAMAAVAVGGGGGRPGGSNDWSSTQQATQQNVDYTIDAGDVVSSVGEVSPERLVYCATLLKEIPQPLMEARGNLLGAIGAVYTLLLDESLEERRVQGALLQEHSNPASVAEARRLWPAVAEMAPEYRLPYLDLLFPTLRRMTPDQFKDFSATVDRLIMADGKVILKEFVIEKVLMHRLKMSFGNTGRKIVQFHSFSAVTNDISVLLSALAHVGHEDARSASVSFGAGRDRIGMRFKEQVHFFKEGEWTFAQVGVALDRLALAGPQIKKVVVDACAYCVMGDGVVTVEEVELLRAICESLDVPLPPFIPEATRRAA